MKGKNTFATGICAALFIGTVFLNGCSTTAKPTAHPESQAVTQDKTNLEQDREQLASQVKLEKVQAIKVQITSGGHVMKGVEYQFFVALPNAITDPKTVGRLQLDVDFSGKSEQILGMSREQKALLLTRTDPDQKVYEVRIASLYRDDFLEQDRDYLIAHTDEAHVGLDVDGENVRSLQ